MNDPPPFFLDRDALRTLCEASRKNAQIAALRRLGIPFGLSVSGRPIVSQTVVDRWIERGTPEIRTRARLEVVSR